MMTFRYLAIFISFFGCNEDSSEIINKQASFCLDTSPSIGVSPNDIDEDFTTTCNTQFPIDTSKFCEVIQKETLLLGETAKCWIPQYQYDLGKIFTYANASGQSIRLTLVDKGHLLVNRITNWERCEEDSTKRNGYCYEIELYYISLKDSASDVEYYIEMRTRMIPFVDVPDIPSPELLIVAVTSNNVARGALLYDKEFDATELLYMHTEFSENISLLNKNFQNVICNARPVVNKAYYNKELGLLGFEDDAEVLWVLEE